MSTILAYNGAFDVQDWRETYNAIGIVFFVISYGILLHFYCAAVVIAKSAVRNLCVVLSGLIVLYVLFLGPGVFRVEKDGAIMVKPEAVNTLLAAVLVLWTAALRFMAEVKLRTESGS